MGVIDDTIDCGLAHDGAQGPERAAAHPLPPSLGALLLAAAPCLAARLDLPRRPLAVPASPLWRPPVTRRCCAAKHGVPETHGSAS